MSATNSGTSTYANFWVYRVDRQWRFLSESEKTAAREELACLLEDAPKHGVTLRGVYSLAGLRPDADLILWVVSADIDAMQAFAVKLQGTALGRYLDTRYTYPGVALGTRYSADHAPAFIKGIPPKRYLSMYPFVKTHEWYQVPFEQRREVMAEHGRLGRDYPEILTNTVSSFGIGDHEFVVAFEGDDIAEMVRMVEHLRPAASRPYTKLDTPIFLGIRKQPVQALLDLG